MFQRNSLKEDSVFRSQLDAGFRFLRFADTLEEDFLESLRIKRKGQWQLALLLIAAFSLIAVISETLRGAADVVSSQLPLFICATFFVTYSFTLGFWQSVTGNLAILCGFAAFAVLVLGFNNAVISPVVMLMLTNAVAAMGAYHREYQERQRFLMEWELKYQANHDQLTGLWNRRALHEHLARAWAHCNREQQRLSLAFIDIDYFKNYNDTYGHIKGDQCLAELGRLLRSTGQRPLDLVARYGGEEFAVLLPNCSSIQAERILDEFREALAKRKIAHANSKVSSQLTVSIGLVSVLPKQATLDFNKLMAAADQALYEAKSRGRNCVVVNKEFDVASEKILEQQKQVKKAQVYHLRAV